jgi:hypothetical protein
MNVAVSVPIIASKMQNGAGRCNENLSRREGPGQPPEKRVSQPARESLPREELRNVA